MSKVSTSQKSLKGGWSPFHQFAEVVIAPSLPVMWRSHISTESSHGLQYRRPHCNKGKPTEQFSSHMLVTFRATCWAARLEQSAAPANLSNPSCRNLLKLNCSEYTNRYWRPVRVHTNDGPEVGSTYTSIHQIVVNANVVCLQRALACYRPSISTTLQHIICFRLGSWSDVGYLSGEKSSDSLILVLPTDWKKGALVSAFLTCGIETKSVEEEISVKKYQLDFNSITHARNGCEISWKKK